MQQPLTLKNLIVAKDLALTNPNKLQVFRGGKVDMFTTLTYLTTRQPSFTTIEFIVSNAPPLNTATAYFIFYLTVLIRVSFGLFTSAIFLTKTHFYLNASDAVPPEKAYSKLIAIELPIIEAVAINTSWRVLIPITLVVLYLCFHRFYTGI